MGKTFLKFCRREDAKMCSPMLFTAQHSTAQHSTAQHSTAQHSTAQHSTAQHSTAQDNCVLFTASKNYIKSDAAGGEGHSIVECLSPSAAFFYAKKFSHYLQRE